MTISRNQNKNQNPKSPSANRSSEVRTGASQSKTRVSDKFKAYCTHHKTVAIESLRRLIKTPLQSLLTWLVVAVAIALPGVLYISLNQFQSLGENWQAKPQLSVFVHYRAREEAVLGLRDRLLAKPEIDSVEYVSPEKALKDFEEFSGLGNVLQTLDENPLPAVLVVKPAQLSSNPAQMESLRQLLTSDPLVDDVRIDMEWVRRLDQIMRIGQRIVIAMACLLSLGVLLVIGNTIRLAIESRRDEIVVVKLVGGTNAFVRRPFLYTGFWYGLGGGIIAWILLTIGVYWLSGPIENLANLYESEGRLKGLSIKESMAILVGSGVLGLLGAWLAVSRHLHTVEPR